MRKRKNDKKKKMRKRKNEKKKKENKRAINIQ